MARKYNYIFKKLVDDETDLIGLVAYGLYKNNKIEYLEKFKDKNGREPTEDELELLMNILVQTVLYIII